MAEAEAAVGGCTNQRPNRRGETPHEAEDEGKKVDPQVMQSMGSKRSTPARTQKSKQCWSR